MAYTIPTAEQLIARYPAFAAVAVATIDVHIGDASTQDVDTSWPEAQYAPAIAAAAAHRMALLGIGEQSEVERYAAAGLSSIRTGDFQASFNDTKVRRSSGGGWDATPYGRAYKTLLRSAKGGPRVVGALRGSGGWGPTAQQNDGQLLP